MIVARSLLVLVTAAILASCAQPNEDPCSRNPRDDGLFGGTVSIVGGYYEACANQLRLELAEAQARAEELRQQAEALEAQAEQLAAERRAAVQRQAQLNRELRDTINRLDRIQQLRKLSQARLSSLRTRERDLSNRLIRAGSGDTALQRDIATLEREQRSLNDELEAIEDELRAGS